MTCADFKTCVEVLPHKVSALWRRQYVSTFIDTESLWYREKIRQTYKCSDGICYLGYLWDCLIPTRRIVSESKLRRELANKGEVMVFWDIHSSDRIKIPNYWKFPKATVLRLSATIL